MFIYMQKGMFSLFSTARDVHILWVVFIIRTVRDVHIFGRGRGCLHLRTYGEGRPLLTVETESNEDSMNTYERDLSLVVHWAPVQEIFILPWLP